MVKTRHTEAMSSGLIFLVLFLLFVAFSPFLTRSGDLDDRGRRGWWINH